MKFEYRVIPLAKNTDEDERVLNELGEEGWEVVAVAFALLILKRVKK